MARLQQTFKQGDVSRAVKGAMAAGIKVESVEITPGGKIIINAESDRSVVAASSPLDEWRSGRGAR